MLVKMIEVAKSNEFVMSRLKDELSKTRGLEKKILLSVIINQKLDVAKKIENGLCEKTITLDSNEGTVELKSEDIKYLFVKQIKDLFKIERHFNTLNEYNGYAETHNVGSRWSDYNDDGRSVYKCYEYLLESIKESKDRLAKEEELIKEQKKAEAEENFKTVDFLGGKRLNGTEKQCALAEKIRAERLAKISDEKVVEKLLKQTTAKWWIDNRDLSIEELAKKRAPNKKQVKEEQKEEVKKDVTKPVFDWFLENGYTVEKGENNRYFIAKDKKIEGELFGVLQDGPITARFCRIAYETTLPVENRAGIHQALESIYKNA